MTHRTTTDRFIVQNPESGALMMRIDQDALRAHLIDYTLPLRRLSAPALADHSETIPADPAASGYVPWTPKFKRAALLGLARHYPRDYLIVSAADLNAVHFEKHPDYRSIPAVARAAPLVILEMVSATRSDTDNRYNQGIYADLAVAISRSSGAIWIISRENPNAFMQRFSVLPPRSVQCRWVERPRHRFWIDF